MEYYTIREKNSESKTLCRIENSEFTIYTWDNGSTGEWLKDRKYEKIFNDKDDNYIIEIPNEKEIESIKDLIDIYAYDDYHEHYDDGEVDSKGRKHKVYIYQDYRSIDGYSVDDGFDYSEVMYREDNEYYYDNTNNLLIRKNKDTGKYYIFSTFVNGSDLFKRWILPKDCDEDIKPIVKEYDFNNIIKINDIKDVLSYISDIYYKRVDELNAKGYHISIW